MLVLLSTNGVGFNGVYSGVLGLDGLFHDGLMPVRSRKSQGASGGQTSDSELILPVIQITEEEITVADPLVELARGLIGISAWAVKPERRSNGSPSI